MIRKTIVGLLLLATLGTITLWAFAFFGGPYTADWDLTEQIWCILWLAPGRCEVSITKFVPIPEWADLPNPFLEKLVTRFRDNYKRRGRALAQRGLTPRNLTRASTIGFESHHRDSAGTRIFPASSIW